MNIIWKKEYETGFEKIDNQHIEIVKIIQYLEENLLNTEDIPRITEIVMDLKIYTINHLDYEERLFKKYNYIGDNLKNHLDKHNDFRNKISEFLVGEVYVKSELAYKISNFLKEWLISHILKTDMKFVKFLKDEGKI